MRILARESFDWLILQNPSLVTHTPVVLRSWERSATFIWMDRSSVKSSVAVFVFVCLCVCV